MRPTDATTHADQSQRNIESIMRLENTALQRRSLGERIAERVTAAAGSSPFVIVHVVWFGAWILINLGLVPGVVAFDRFPFGFLALIISLEVMFLTLVVLMSQKRLMKDADKRAHLELQLNMLAEQESTQTLRMLRRICHHLGVQEEEGESAQQLEKPTDVDQLVKTIEKNLSK